MPDQVSLLGRLHHRNLVNLVGYCEEKSQRILAYEFMTHGSLEQRLTGEPNFSKPIVTDYILFCQQIHSQPK